MRACRRRVSDLVRRRTCAITVPTLSAKLPARTLSDNFSWFGSALGYLRRGGARGAVGPRVRAQSSGRGLGVGVRAGLRGQG